MRRPAASAEPRGQEVEAVSSEHHRPRTQPGREAGPRFFGTQSQTRLPAPAARVFAHLDDHARLSAHMSRRSWRMGWGKMEIQLDEQAGRAVGSRIRLAGRVFGVWLELEEVVTEYAPPARKVWATMGTPRLLVIGPYRMGFELVPEPSATGSAGSDGVMLTVFIEYRLPERGLPRLLGRLFGHAYARWCTARMVADAAGAFAPSGPEEVASEGRQPAVRG